MSHMLTAGDEIQPGWGGGVLLIEDRSALIDSVQSCLGERGYRTLTVSSFDQAVRGAERPDVALVLLRYRLLNQLGGKELLQALRAVSPRRRLPIIALLDQEADWKAASMLDFEDYLPDPFSLDDLTHLVDENCR
ncbi:MAG: response regulator [Myxococcales bacterium]|nr:response regulator [Myxococcales bacterium]